MSVRSNYTKKTSTNHPDFIKFVVENYHDDPCGYMEDILGMKPAEWQQSVASDIVNYRRVAVQSGHGVGKTALCAAMIHWFLATRPRPQIVATANTETQLTTKLWREVAKVNNNAKNRDWFDWTATKFMRANDPTAFAQGITWNENNPESFAGTHEEHVLGIFDEASGIPPIIWTTFSGAMSTDGARWLATGNPTQNTGTFFEACNGKLKWKQEGDELKGLWRGHTVAAMDSPFVSPAWVEEQKVVLGEHSNEYNIRVLGIPPRTSPDQFISPEIVELAMDSKIKPYYRSPLVLGVDVSRQGGDRTVICPRIGATVPDRIKEIDNKTLKEVVKAVADEIYYWREEMDREVRAVFIEGGGSLGWGVIEDLWSLGFEQVRDINPAARSSDPDRFSNKKAEMWSSMKDWLEEGGCELPRNDTLLEELITIKQKPDMRNRVKLETKDELRRRGVRSPDYADALALTFAEPVESEPNREEKEEMLRQEWTINGEYDYMTG